MIRVYLPATFTTLRALRDNGSVDAATAHAVTPALREWYVEGDAEELEYAAMLDAAEGSLRLLAADAGAPRRRAVVAADVPEDWVGTGGEGRSEVPLSRPVPRERVASVHVDDTEAEGDVAAAVEALPAADAGDEDARFTVDGADGHDLLWYDVTELDDLLA